MALNEPINDGAPSIMETVNEWLSFSSDYSEEAKIRCSNETGIPIEILDKFWGMFVAYSDIPKSEYSKTELLKSWIRHFPNGTRNACNMDLHLGTEYLAEHWEECGGTIARTQISKDGDIAREWVKEHPDGTFYDCLRETGIRNSNLAKYWPEYMNNATRSELNDIIRTERVSEWIKAHPDGVLTECASQLSIERALLERVWKAAGGSTLNSGSKNDKTKKIIKQWIASGKTGGVMQCVKETGINKHAVSKFWKECGGSSLNMQEQRSLESEKTIKRWVEIYPLGSLYECSKQTGIGVNTVRKYWFKCGGKSEEARLAIKISEYQKLFPDGNKKDCAEYLKEPPKSVARYFELCKDPEYCKQAINASGSEEVRNAISRWIQENPEGTVTECQTATGYSKITVQTYWHQLGGRDLTRRYTQKERKANPNTQMDPDSFEKISKWVAENPGKGKKQCRMETGVSRRAVIKYWDEANGIGMSTAKRNENRKKVQKWFEEHPDGTHEECSKATGVSTAVIVKFVRELDLNNKEYNENIAELKSWLEQHPFGSKLDCQRELGIGKNFITKHWAEFGGFVGSKKDRLYYKTCPVLEDWWNKYPNGTKAQCRKDTGISFTHINRYLAEKQNE